jgi:hypothetical protein
VHDGLRNPRPEEVTDIWLPQTSGLCGKVNDPAFLPPALYPLCIVLNSYEETGSDCEFTKNNVNPRVQGRDRSSS